MMSTFVWKPEYSVNIKVIDEQHKKLVDTINILYDAMSEGKGRAVLAEIFNNLAEYATVHFATEQDFMVGYSYPDYIEHKNEHDKFVLKVEGFKKQFEKGQISLPIEIATFLVDWLHKHLIEMDQKYKAFFNEKGLL